MYNADVKQKYLLYASVSESLNKRVFGLVEEFEREINCDVSEMTCDQYKECIKRTKRETMEDMMAIHSACSKYAKWCAQTFNTPLPDWVLYFDCYTQFEKLCSFPPVFVWDDIYSDILSIYPITEGYAIWPIIVCAWCGLSIKECCELKNEDIDFKHRTIHVGEKSYKIEYDSQLKILQAYSNTNIGNREQNRKFIVEMLDVGYFIKFYKTKNSKKKGRQYTGNDVASQFATALAKAQADNVQLSAMYSYSLIWNMGRYHQMHILDMNTPGGVELAKKKDVQDIFRVKYAHPTGKMLLTQYQVYKHRLEEKRK